MTLSKNIKNGVIYPTELYYQYNLYLQKEYDLFYFIVKNEKIIEELLRNKTLEIINDYIKKIDNLLYINISDDPENIFSVMDWEEYFYYYKIIDGNIIDELYPYQIYRNINDNVASGCFSI